MQIVAIVHKQKKTYGVSFPDLPGCVTAGSSLHEAMANASAAVAAHLAVMADHGDPMPILRNVDTLRADPEFADDFEGHEALVLVPFEPPTRSVRVNITLDEAMLRAIDRAAETIGMTRSGFLADAARARLASRS